MYLILAPEEEAYRDATEQCFKDTRGKGIP